MVALDEGNKARELDDAVERYQALIEGAIRQTLAEYRSFLGDPESLTKDKLQQLYQPQEADLVESGFKVLVVSCLLGMDHVGTDLSLADEPGAYAKELPYEEAVALLKGRVPVTKAEWKKLEPKLRFRAFTIAKLAQYEAIDKVRQGLISNLESGEGMASFWDQLEAKEAGSPYYWETVYRTNIQTVYNTGRRIQIDKTKPDALQLIVIHDERTTKNICLPLIGLILPYTHTFWKTHWPPFHFNCRTTVRAIYKQAKSGALAPMTALQKTFKAQSGFGRNPVDSGTYWMMLPEMFNRGLVTGAITQFNFMENVLADYDKVWKGYKRGTKTATGWVDVPDLKPEDLTRNRPVADDLASNGYRVKILPEFPSVRGWKNPDILIDSQLFDIKEVESMTKRGVESRLRSAQSQNLQNAVLRIPAGMDLETVKRGLVSHIKSDWNRIERVIVVISGKAFDLTKEKILQNAFGF